MAMKNKIMALFAISLTVNVFFAGMLVGKNAAPQKNMSDSLTDSGSEKNDVDDAQQRANTSRHPRVAGEIIQKVKPNIKEMKAIRTELSDIFSAENFDEQKAQAAFEKLRQMHSETQETMHKQLIEKAAQMPLEERKELIQFLNKHRRYNGGRGGGMRRHGRTMVHMNNMQPRDDRMLRENNMQQYQQQKQRMMMRRRIMQEEYEGRGGDLKSSMPPLIPMHDNMSNEPPSPNASPMLMRDEEKKK